MSTYDVFISHRSLNKEIANLTWQIAINNGLKPWYDQTEFVAGDRMHAAMQAGVEQSASFVLFASEEALDSEWVQLEMVAARTKKECDEGFRILVVPLGGEDRLDVWWAEFLRIDWRTDDEPGSILRLLEALTQRSVTAWITGAAFLTHTPSDVFMNESASLAEHSRNWLVLYVAQIKSLLSAIVTTGNWQEDRDTLEKLLTSSLMKQLPNIQGPWVMLEPGVFEVIHGNRMRIPPQVTIRGLPEGVAYEVVEGNELFTTVRIIEEDTGDTFREPFPFALTVELSSEL